MKKLLNDRWEFLKMPGGSTAEEAGKQTGWMQVDLPHDWLIWQHNDLYESADACYRREIDLPAVPECAMLSFDGVYMDCDILVNGKKVCSHAYGYTAFHADLTDELLPGRNEVMVYIRHQSPNSRWYSGSGIFRDVNWVELPAQHIVPDSFYITEKEDGGDWHLRIQAETSKTDRSSFCCIVVDAEGKQVASGSTESSDGNVDLALRLKGAEAWDPEHPVLYTLRYTFGEETGEQRFGLRTVEYDPDRGLILNHRKIKLKGVCLHHDLGALGAAFHTKAAKRQLQLMKDMGVNALRTSHNPPAAKLLDLCDEMGILVDDEAFDMWERPKTEYDYARFFPEHEAEDVALWIRRDRCHPSVILWSIGNEIYDMHADLRGTEVCTILKQQVRAHDPEGHAAVTFGCNYMPWEGGQRCADVVKVAGYNYGEKYYEEHHRKHPDWVIYGSETASVLSSRNIYHFPIEKSIMSESDLQCSALGNSNTSWGATDLREMITADLKCGYSMGQFIWSGIDYIGEPTPYHTRSCYFGQADTACYPKDPYYLFQSLWSDRKVLHIGVYWDWNPGQMIDVPVMTNYSRVELLLNGKSLGMKEVQTDDAEKCLPVWKVPYESGELKARALDENGNVLEEKERKSFGDTAELHLVSEDEFLLGDGQDLAFVTVQALDGNGNPVENARDRVRIKVSGGAYLAGTDNGDSTDADGYKQSSRRLFGGKLLLIIASNGLKEDAKITVESTGGLRAEAVIPVHGAPVISGTSCVLRIPEGKDDGRIPVRKIEITAVDEPVITKEHPVCCFRWKQLPENAQGYGINWQITNEAGIESPYAEMETEGDLVRVRGLGDGDLILRALGGNAEDHPEMISQIGFSVRGVGQPAMDPYTFVSAGLYDLYEGEIGTGNEKGIAFARDGESMIGFSRVDFGNAGSDTLILPIFALNGDPYDIELLDGDPRKDGKVLAMLHYEKPSIWNVYQEETYHLPGRLKGIHTLCFRMRDKVHMKGFRFEKQSRATDFLYAGEADTIYGDSFEISGKAVRKIGNNVSLCYEGMDFGEGKEWTLMIRGKTELQVNAITVRFRNEAGETENAVADFIGNGEDEQYFRLHTPGGMCEVTFVFLPGSRFDFEGFRFQPSEG